MVRVSKSFTEAAAFADFVVAQGCQPEAFADNVGLQFEVVFGARFEQTEEVLDNHGCRVVSFEIDQSLAVDGRSIDERWLLGVVDQIACIDACFWVSYELGQI